MLPFFDQIFGNPHSKNHQFGWDAEKAVLTAKKQIADFLKTEEDRIFFTSGATESNIIALRGVIDYFRYKKKIQPVSIAVSAIEHPSIIQTCQQLKEEGVEVAYIPVQNDGRLSLDETNAIIKSVHPVLVSVMAVNSETGVIQPIDEISRLCQENEILFHCDATQALGKMSFHLDSIDIASFSSHKIYGPKGIGALYIRRGIKMRSPFMGAGQQKGIRGGTLPVPLCVGFGQACDILSHDQSDEMQRIQKLSDYLIKGIESSVPLAKLNGDAVHKVPHILNVSFPYVEGESIIMGLENIAVSTGSACSSERLTPSPVLQAMHVPDLFISSAVRFGLHRFTTQQDVDRLLEKLPIVISKLRQISPLWEMYQEGVDFSRIQWAAD